MVDLGPYFRLCFGRDISMAEVMMLYESACDLPGAKQKWKTYWDQESKNMIPLQPMLRSEQNSKSKKTHK